MSSSSLRNTDDEGSAVSVEGNWAFPAAAGVLDSKQLHQNPDWPEPNEVDEEHQTAADLCVAIKYKSEDPLDRDDGEEKWAEMFYVGSRRPAQVVHGRKVKPGWYAIIPSEGSYSVYVANWSPQKVACSVYLDGERVGWLGIRPDQTQSLPASKISPAIVEENAPFDGKKFGQFEFHFRDVEQVDKVVKEKASTTPRKTQKKVSNPSKHVNEKKKNNLTFMSVAQPPPVREAPPNAPSVGSKVNRWRMGDFIRDSALPTGNLVIHYRTKLWAIAAQWIQNDMDEAEEEERHAEAYERRLAREDDTDGSRRGKKRSQSSQLQSSTSAKRAKVVESPAALAMRRFQEAMGTLSDESTATDLFRTMAPLHDRQLDDYQPVIDHLSSKNVTTVKQMSEISHEDWIASYLPPRMPPTAKKALRTSITEALVYIKSRAVFVDLGDDDDED